MTGVSSISILLHGSLEATWMDLFAELSLQTKKTMLYYEGRDDKLVYRSITFDEKQREEAMRSASKTKSGASDAGVVKMAEKFERTSSKTAATDVRKRTYFKTTGGIRLDYHFGDGRITSNVKTFNKEGRVQIIQLDGAQKEDKDIAYKVVNCWNFFVLL
mmetsp:Transcript_23840/g.60248  ORF Transcript_23840/g.60248 Transcript_23840/m.60248 type:complete len:160 (-) Transcript_23840:2462-2941(-)